MQAICAAVAKLLALPLEERRTLGQVARGAFLRQRQQLVARMAEVRALLAARLGRTVPDM